MNEELYFKDAFTEVDGNINLDVNNLNANCITSKNNKFSLDSDGNLVVKSITTEVSNNIDFDSIYPVGSIYLSLLNTNPSTLFGGTWEQIAKGKTLIGVDTSQTEFNTVRKEGGKKSHNHNLDTDSAVASIQLNYDGSAFYHEVRTSLGKIPKNYRSAPTEGTGGDYTHSSVWGAKLYGYTQETSNVPPYLTCYIWTRTS